MKLSIATVVLLAQTALCDAVLQAREAEITAAAALHHHHRRASDECSAGKTACGDGNGCCPRGSKCTTAKGGVGMCAGACDGATLFCEFGKGVKLCCQPGAGCDYSQSVCTQHSTDAGGVWTTTAATSSTSTESGTRLPTAPVFSSTSDGGDSSTDTETDATTTATVTESSTSESSVEGTSRSSTESSAAATSGPGTTGGEATPSKNPKDSGSTVGVSWSVGVLAVVFGIMVAL